MAVAEAVVVAQVVKNNKTIYGKSNRTYTKENAYLLSKSLLGRKKK
jgi:hypothetical protein